MNIKELIKQCYDNAVEKGFYNCDNCDGTGILQNSINNVDIDIIDCLQCNGTGIYKDIDYLILRIIEKVIVCFQAYERKDFCKMKELDLITDDLNDNITVTFNEYVKDKFEDSIAGVYVMIFSFIGYFLNNYLSNKNIDVFINAKHSWESKLKSKNIYNQLKEIIKFIGMCDDFSFLDKWIVIDLLNNFCKIHNIDIEKFIELKLAYMKIKRINI